MPCCCCCWPAAGAFWAPGGRPCCKARRTPPESRVGAYQACTCRLCVSTRARYTYVNYREPLANGSRRQRGQLGYVLAGLWVLAPAPINGHDFVDIHTCLAHWALSAIALHLHPPAKHEIRVLRTVPGPFRRQECDWLRLQMRLRCRHSPIEAGPAVKVSTERHHGLTSQFQAYIALESSCLLIESSDDLLERLLFCGLLGLLGRLGGPFCAGLCRPLLCLNCLWRVSQVKGRYGRLYCCGHPG